MKKLLFILFIANTFHFYSQSSVTRFLVDIKPISIGADAEHRPKYKTDSVMVMALVSFSQNVSEIKEVYFKLGNSQDSDEVINKIIHLTHQNNKTYVSYDNLTYPIAYGKNMTFSLKVKTGSNLTWGTVSCKNNEDVISSKSFCQVPNN